MIGLYIKKFNVDFSPPENITSFYRNIFEIVATTHDRTKGGFTRKSSSELSQEKLEKIFERFCFECYKLDQTSFEKKDIIDVLNTTLIKLSIHTCTSIQILEDLCNYLCLLVKDGTNYTFIHRSIFEYYVAYFFSNLSKENVEKTIPTIKNTNFLKVLNDYYFNKFYFKNEIESILEKFSVNIRSFMDDQEIPTQLISIIKIKTSGPYPNLSKQDSYYDSAYIEPKTFSILESHAYILKEFFSPIFRYLDEKENFKGIIVDNLKVDKQATQILYANMNRDTHLKDLYRNIYLSYENCIQQIQAKENEITEDDLYNL